MKYIYFVHYSVQSRYMHTYNPFHRNAKVTIDVPPGTWNVVDEIIKKIGSLVAHEDFVISNFILVETINEPAV